MPQIAPSGGEADRVCCDVRWAALEDDRNAPGLWGINTHERKGAIGGADGSNGKARGGRLRAIAPILNRTATRAAGEPIPSKCRAEQRDMVSGRIRRGGHEFQARILRACSRDSSREGSEIMPVGRHDPGWRKITEEPIVPGAHHRLREWEGMSLSPSFWGLGRGPPDIRKNCCARLRAR